jgi:hypothetical protein
MSPEIVNNVAGAQGSWPSPGPGVSAGDSSLTLVPTTTKNPFGRAIDDFLAELTQQNRGDVKNPFLREILRHQSQSIAADASVEGPGTVQLSAEKLQTFMEHADSKQQAKLGYRIADRLSPFTDALTMWMETCETVVGASPFGVGAAFSGAQVVLELALSFHNYLEIIVEAMERIGDSIVSYKMFAEAFHASPEFQDRLVRSYKRIIEFWYSVSKNLSHRTVVFKSIMRPLIDETKEALDGLREDRNHIQGLAQATESLRTTRHREATSRDAIRQWILGKNDHVDVRNDLDDKRKQRQEGTCTWMFEDERFTHWRDTKDNAVLWYNAPPGSGKSVMASAVLDHLSERGAKVAWFFFSFSNPSRKQGMHVLRSFCLQLLTILDTIPDSVNDIFATEMKHYAVHLSSPAVAATTLHKLISQCGHLYIVIDGIDECGDEKDFLPVLQKLIGMPTYGIVKWLFTSRNQASVRKVMEAVKATEMEVLPGSVHVLEDVQKYFSANLTVSASTSEYTDGEDNFLYARFVCETLRGEGLTCEADIQNALERFPRNLNAYYIRALEKIAARSLEDQELAR